MTDPNWLSTCQALDHHDTATALDRSVQGQLGEALAEELAAGLARTGYALVRTDQRDEGKHHTEQDGPGFLDREED